MRCVSAGSTAGPGRLLKAVAASWGDGHTAARFSTPSGPALSKNIPDTQLLGFWATQP